MPRHSPKSTSDNPSPRKDANGKIVSWLAKTDDAKDLKMLVEAGRLDGLTPGQIMDKYPQFSKYKNGTFSSALRNCRNAHNNAVFSRATPGGGDRKFCVDAHFLLILIQ
jgi:hypothetical protein